MRHRCAHPTPIPSGTYRRLVERAWLACALTVATVAVSAAPADAHVKASPPLVTAGAPSTIQLTVEEGCAKAPTIELRVKLPLAFGAVSAPTAPDGWVGEQAADVLTFTGPGLPADAPFVVGFTVTVDASLGGTIQPLPSVQLCQDTKDPVRWIDLPIAGQPEPAHPAALLTVLPAPAPTTVPTTAVPTTVATTAPTTTVAPTTAAPTTAAATTVPTTAAPTTTATTLAPVVAPKPPSGGSSGSTVAVVVGVVAALSAAGGFVLARRRSTSNPTPT